MSLSRYDRQDIFRDYVYLYYGNYLKYRDKNSDQEIKDYFDQFKGKITKTAYQTKSIPLKTLRNFENFLNTYFNPYKKGGTLEYKTGALTEEAKAIIDNYVLKTIRTKTPDAYFDSALRGYSHSQADPAAKASAKAIAETQYHYRQTIERRLQDIKTIVNNMSGAQSVNIIQASAAYENICRIWKEVQKDFVSSKKGVNWDRLYMENVNDANRPHQELIDEINKFYSTYVIDGSANITGKVGELVLAALGLAYEHGVENLETLLDEQLLTRVIGDKPGQTGIQTLITKNGKPQLRQAPYTDAQYAQRRNKTQIERYGDGVFNANTSQGKTDIVIKLADEDIKVSVKNYNLSNKNNMLTFVGGANLEDLTSRESKFITHYLNITQAHPQANIEKHPEYVTKNNKNELNKQPSLNTLQEIHNTMRMFIMSQSIIGGMFRKTKNADGTYSTGYEMVDLVIVNDNTTGRFRVYYPQNIIKRVADAIGSLKIMDNITHDINNAELAIDQQGYPENATFRYDPGAWHDTPWESDYGLTRRNYLYEQMHKIKIKTQIKARIFKEFFDKKI